MKRDDIIRMAEAAGMGQHMPAENGLPGTWCGAELGALERFANLVASHVLSQKPPSIMISAKDIDPALLRDMLLKAPPMPIVPIEPDHDVAAAVAAECEACAKVCESTPWTSDIDWWRRATKREVSERSAHECAAAIRARKTA